MVWNWLRQLCDSVCRATRRHIYLNPDACGMGGRATGASALQEVIFGVIPQVLPLWISYSLYRFESNVRSATVVGMVGAGGIGVILWEAIRGFQFGQTAALLLIIIAVVSLIDLLSQRLRKRFI